MEEVLDELALCEAPPLEVLLPAESENIAALEKLKEELQKQEEELEQLQGIQYDSSCTDGDTHAELTVLEDSDEEALFRSDEEEELVMAEEEIECALDMEVELTDESIIVEEDITDSEIMLELTEEHHSEAEDEENDEPVAPSLFVGERLEAQERKIASLKKRIDSCEESERANLEEELETEERLLRALRMTFSALDEGELGADAVSGDEIEERRRRLTVVLPEADEFVAHRTFQTLAEHSRKLSLAGRRMSICVHALPQGLDEGDCEKIINENHQGMERKRRATLRKEQWGAPEAYVTTTKNPFFEKESMKRRLAEYIASSTRQKPVSLGLPDPDSIPNHDAQEEGKMRQRRLLSVKKRGKQKAGSEEEAEPVNAEEYRKKILEATEAKEELKGALDDIKLRILDQESTVARLKSSLLEEKKGTAGYDALKSKVDEEEMLLYALQINVMVFRKFIDNPVAAAPSSSEQNTVESPRKTGRPRGPTLTSSTGQGWKQSKATTPRSPRNPAPLLSRRQTSRVNVLCRSSDRDFRPGGSREKASVGAVKPLTRRFTGASLARPSHQTKSRIAALQGLASMSMESLWESVPELRERTTYPSSCSNLAEVLLDGKFSPLLITVNIGHDSEEEGYQLKAGTLRDIVTWMLFHTVLRGADNLDLRAFLLSADSYVDPSEIIETLQAIWKYHENGVFPREFGLTGMHKRCVQQLHGSTVNNSISSTASTSQHNAEQNAISVQHHLQMRRATWVFRGVLLIIGSILAFADQWLRFAQPPLAQEHRTKLLQFCISTGANCKILAKVAAAVPVVNDLLPGSDKFSRISADTLNAAEELPSQEDMELLLQESASAIAHELTAHMQQLIFELGHRLTEFSDMKWTKPDTSEAPTLHLLSVLWNKIFVLPVASILMADTPKQQASAYKLWVRVAQCCFEQKRDFNTTAAIVAGLCDISITRLKKINDFIPDKYSSEVSMLETAMSPSNNFKEYRSLYASVVANQETFLPYIAVHLRDLTFLLEGNAKYLKGNPRHAKQQDDVSLINFERIRMFDEVVFGMEIHALPVTMLPVPKNAALHDLIMRLPLPSSDQLYDLSLKVEPPSQQALQQQVAEQRWRIQMLETENEQLKALVEHTTEKIANVAMAVEGDGRAEEATPSAFTPEVPSTGIHSFLQANSMPSSSPLSAMGMPGAEVDSEIVLPPRSSGSDLPRMRRLSGTGSTLSGTGSKLPKSTHATIMQLCELKEQADEYRRRDVDSMEQINRLKREVAELKAQAQRAAELEDTVARLQEANRTLKARDRTNSLARLGQASAGPDQVLIRVIYCNHTKTMRFDPAMRVGEVTVAVIEKLEEAFERSRLLKCALHLATPEGKVHSLMNTENTLHEALASAPLETKRSGGGLFYTVVFRKRKE